MISPWQYAPFNGDIPSGNLTLHKSRLELPLQKCRNLPMATGFQLVQGSNQAKIGFQPAEGDAAREIHWISPWKARTEPWKKLISEVKMVFFWGDQM
jgi:hypothetical protein